MKTAPPSRDRSKIAIVAISICLLAGCAGEAVPRSQRRWLNAIAELKGSMRRNLKYAEEASTPVNKKWYSYRARCFQRGVAILNSHREELPALPLMISVFQLPDSKERGLPSRGLLIIWLETGSTVIGVALTNANGATIRYTGFDPNDYLVIGLKDDNYQHSQHLFFVNQDSETVEQFPGLTEPDTHYVEVPASVMNGLSEEDAFQLRLIRSDGTESEPVEVFSLSEPDSESEQASKVEKEGNER